MRTKNLQLTSQSSPCKLLIPGSGIVLSDRLSGCPLFSPLSSACSVNAIRISAVRHLRASFLLLSITALFVAVSLSQTKNMTATGIVLVSDHRCANTQSHDPFCRESDWALVSGRSTYLLYGDVSTLQKFERRRARVSGTLEEEPVIRYGMHLVRRRITISSIETDEPTEREIERFVEQLKVVPWRGPENHCSPMCWDFAFTDPMMNILLAGHAAQDVVLRHISDEQIKDQVVMLLGGIGDEKAIPPIIENMANANEARFNPKAKRLNLIGNLALTNLTVSEVIWHHGGGISPDKCPDDPKSCWSKWWNGNRESFRVGVGGDRLYSNYPNYGIYMQFGDTSVR